MLISILVARVLGPEGQGYVSYIILIFTLLGNFGHLGIINAVAYFQKKSSFGRGEIMGTNLSVLALLSAFWALVILLLHKSGSFLSTYSGWYILGGIALMSFSLFVGHHQSWLVGDEKIIKNNRIGLFCFFFKNLLILLLFAFGRLSPASFFFVTVINMILWFGLIQSSVRERVRLKVSGAVLKAELAYGIIAWASSLFVYLHYRVDQIMIKSYLGLGDLGVYTVAVNIAELLFLLPISIHSALSGRLYNLAAGDNGRELMARTLRISLFLCFILGLVGVGGAFLIPIVYGKAYAYGTPLMLILLPGILFASVPTIVGPWYFSSGRPMIPLKITFITLMSNIVLNWILIPKMGSAGAAWASTVSYVIYGLYYLFYMHYKEGFSISELLIIKKQDWIQAKGFLS